MKNIPIEYFVEYLSKRLDPTDELTILEVGSKDAKDSLKLKAQFPNARVIAFEAHTEEWRKVNPEGIQWVNLAIYNKNGTIPFYCKDLGSGIHSIRDRGRQYGNLVFEVLCCRLDDWCDDHGIKNIDIIKIDVEGCTYEVLEGMGDLLKTVKYMHIETEDYQFFASQKLDNEVTELLTDFECDLKCGCEITGSHKQFDSIWRNKWTTKKEN
jgi:FkbM family methyltransferase